MKVKLAKTLYSGRIREVKLGKGKHAVTIGGEGTYPFYLFEGETPHPPRIAMEVWDMPPEDWPEAARAPYRDVIHDPVAWARKSIKEYGAEIICLALASTDPNGLNRPASEAAAVVKRVAEAISVPLIVWGTANHEQDTAVLREAAMACEKTPLILSPIEEGDYRRIGAIALAYRHMAIASSPIDVNLAKQLNIMMQDLGIGEGQLMMDPTVSGIGYGIEYCYSVMERLRIAALTQGDTTLQYPLVCNLANEAWKNKESRLTEAEAPLMGDAANRGILIEAISAMLLALAGADVIVMRHPQAISLVKNTVGELLVPPEAAD